MRGTYRIIGSELSPYSVKVRSYCRYKSLPHEWLPRTPEHEQEFQAHAKLPLVPLVITPEGEARQDSTPIIDMLEEVCPEPSVHPKDTASRFLSVLLEEFADEWGNKWMFHYRWWREADQKSAADRLCRQSMPNLGTAEHAQMVEMIRSRMIGRIGFVGSSEKTKDLIEGSFKRGLALIEAHLAPRPYLFGARPAYADFALFGQLYECRSDPTAGDMIRAGFPNVDAFISRMVDPLHEGPYEPLDDLADTLRPLLSEAVGGHFLPWSDANARAIAAGQDRFSVDLASGPFEQAPQKYHAKSLKVLRERYAEVAGDGALDAILDATGCRRWLLAA